jgi:VCBS repeat-containing protein
VIGTGSISDLTFTRGTGRGAGLYLAPTAGSALLVERCIVRDNTSTVSGGIGITALSGTITVRNVLIVGNTTPFTVYFGSGLFAGADATVHMTNCTVTANSSGVSIWRGSLNNCIATGNPGGFNYSGSSYTTERNSLINGDAGFLDAAGGDYHLRGTSSCRNAGANGAPAVPADDLEGTARPLEGTVDIGAYEFANTAPAGRADAYTARYGAALTVGAPGVLANDTDADFDALSAGTLSEPAHGTLTLQANGAFVYTPEAGWIGEDSFTYQLRDGAAVTGPVTVTLTTRGVLHVPADYATIQAAIEIRCRWPPGSITNA